VGVAEAERVSELFFLCKVGAGIQIIGIKNIDGIFGGISFLL